jgi:uncharacterized membrane protein
LEWTRARYADKKPTVEVRIRIDAPPQRVWQLVSNVELMPSISQELQSVEWLDGATWPTVRARYHCRLHARDLGAMAISC